MTEVWKDIADFEGFYQVSSLGRVRSLPCVRPHPRGPRKHSGRILQTNKGSLYPMASLWKAGHREPVDERVHILVATAFLGPKPHVNAEVNHKNGIKANCRKSNLEWTTKAGNATHARRVLRVGSITITAQIARQIKRRLRIYRWGDAAKLAREFGISIQIVYHIKYGRCWCDV